MAASSQCKNRSAFLSGISQSDWMSTRYNLVKDAALPGGKEARMSSLS